MADETEREALARLIAGGRILYMDGAVIMDEHWRESREIADRLLAAGYVSPFRHRAEVEAVAHERDAFAAEVAALRDDLDKALAGVEAAWKAGRDAANVDEIAQQIRIHSGKGAGFVAEQIVGYVRALTPPSGDHG